jgi:PAS domain S-box-containing protein
MNRHPGRPKVPGHFAPGRDSSSAEDHPQVRQDGHLDRQPFRIDVGATAAADLPPAAEPLDDRARFESLLANLSAAFVNLPPADVDDRIDDALRQVVEFLDVDRAGFGEVSDPDLALRLTHTYSAPGFLSSAPGILESQLPWYSAMIRRGGVMRLSPIPDCFPAEADREKEYCERIGMKSHLTIPLRVGGAVRFVIGCTSFREYRGWPDEVVQRLRLLGEVFANALARRRADEELGRRERLYRKLVESTRAVPWEADPNGNRTLYISPRIVSLLGYPLGSWYRDGFWASRLHPDDRGSVLHGIATAARTGRDHEMEYRLVAADGRTVWVHDLITAQADGAAPTVVRGMMIDVTDRKAAEHEAARLRDQLGRAARLTTLGELTATIAHEINQPLTAIIANAETTQDYLSGGAADMDEVREALDDIVADGRRASEIIHRIRALVRTHQPERALFDVNAAAREVAGLLRHRWVRDSVALTHEFGVNLPPVLGDRVQIQEVILNLLVNAADAVSGAPADRRRVALSTDGNGDAVTVSVRDTGPGVSLDLLDRLFDAFFTTKPDGTGIGLSVSRTIVEAHGGRIWVELAPGGGAEFKFTLPAVTGPAP